MRLSHPRISSIWIPLLLAPALILGGCGKDKASPTAATVGPTANFTRTPSGGAPPLVVQFTDASTAGTSAITAWQWDFGDGGTSTAQNPAHTYTTDGSYQVHLTVTTPVGSNTKTDASSIVVATSTLSDAQVQAVLQQAGLQQPLSPRDDVADIAPPVANTEFVTYTARRHDQVTNITEINTLGNNDDVLFPGAIIRGDGVNNFIYNPISPGPTALRRAPITLSLDLAGTPGVETLSKQVTDISLSGVTTGINDLIRDASLGSVPAQIEYRVKQVYNEEHLAMQLDASFSAKLQDVSGSFRFNDYTKTSKFVASYKQIYFTVNMNNPNGVSGFFAPGVTESELRAAFPSQSQPMYVSGVKMGMMAFLTIESSESSQATELALNFARQGLWDAKVAAGRTTRDVMNSSNVALVIYGGSTDPAAQFFRGADNVISKFSELIAQNTNYSGFSKPLGYRFRHLSTFGLANLTETAQYTELIPLRIRQQVRLTAIEFKCNNADDEGTDNTIEMVDLFLQVFASNGRQSPQPPDPIPSEQGGMIFRWNAGEYSMNTGDVMTCAAVGSNVRTLTMDTNPVEGFDFERANLRFVAYGNEYDAFSANETGSGEFNAVGGEFLTNGGTKQLRFTSPDFDFTVKFKIELQ